MSQQSPFEQSAVRSLGTKAIAKELVKRILRHTKQEPSTPDLELAKYYYSLPKLGRKNIYTDKNISPEEKTLERIWWWLTERPHEKHSGWANNWMTENPCGTVGTKNYENRRKWLKKTLAALPSNKRILDAGAGECQYKDLCSHLKYVSQDFAEYTGGGKEGLQTGSWDNSKLDIISDITQIPVQNESFDAIMCTEVFEHIPKPIDAIGEFSRILKKGGTLIITTPFASMTHFAPYYFYNGYSRYFYEKILEEHGFTIEEISYNGNYFEYIAQELRRLEGIEEMYAANSIKKMSNIEKLAQRILLNRLAELSKNDKKSHELLCHGINIRAVKK